MAMKRQDTKQLLLARVLDSPDGLIKRIASWHVPLARWSFLVRPARFPLLMAIVAAACLFGLAPAREILYRQGERRERGFQYAFISNPDHRDVEWIAATIATPLALVLFAFTVRLAARATIRYRYGRFEAERWWYDGRVDFPQGFPPTEGGKPEPLSTHLETVLRWVDRIALLPLCVAALITTFQRSITISVALWLALLVCVLIFRRRHRRWLESDRSVDDRRDELDAGTIVFHRALVLALFLGASMMTFTPLGGWMPQWVGSTATLFFALSCITAMFTFIVIHPVMRYWPLGMGAAALVLLVWIGGLARLGLSDNHGIRQVHAGREEEQRQILERPTLDERLARWLWERSNERNLASKERPYGLIVVAAPGGGLRAAMWTAASLARMEQDSRRQGSGEDSFHRHVFAITGVSGGALGALIFNAALLGQDRNAIKDDDLQWCVLNLLNTDFLAPVLAGTLMPDFVQRFLPFPILPDRQQFLEEAWERSWAESFESGPGLDGGFLMH